MRVVTKRVGAWLAAAAVLAGAAGMVAARRLRVSVRQVLAPPVEEGRPLQFVGLADEGGPLERWGVATVDALALAPDGLLVAGGSGVELVRGRERRDIGHGLPSLAVAALTLWRGEPVVAPRSGGLFRLRHGRWEEARSGWGALEVRALAESEAGELLVGARQGLFRAAWGGLTLERLSTHPVRSIALGREALLLGGESGLFHVDGRRVVRLPTSDPWIDDVGVSGGLAYAATPSGLLRGEWRSGRTFVPVSGGGGVTSGVMMDGVFHGIDEGDRFALRRFSADRSTVEILPAPARRLLVASGVLFADTREGLFRREAGGWKPAAPRPAALPPGSAHVTALAVMGSDLVAGLFDGGLVLGREQGGARSWRAVPGTAAWGVNALLPAGGALYVASLRGAARFDGARLQPLEGPGAAFSLAATEHGVAIGYGQGVLLPGSRLLSAFHGLPGNQALALAAGDSLFVGTPSGLGAIGDGGVRWRVGQGEGRLPHPWVTALAVGEDGLYVGTYGGGIVRRTASPVEAAAARRDGALYEPFVETDGLKVNAGCLVEAEGRLYAGTDGGGLYRLSLDRTRFEPVPLALPSRRVTALLAVPGALWVGTDEGLARVALPPGGGE